MCIRDRFRRADIRPLSSHSTPPLESLFLPSWNVRGGRKSARGERRPLSPLEMPFNRWRIEFSPRLIAETTCPCRALQPGVIHVRAPRLFASLFASFEGSGG
eukprot:8043482-Pyramimonas_sp.AAC.1